MLKIIRLLVPFSYVTHILYKISSVMYTENILVICLNQSY
jgi:hypothetical protein